MNRQLGFWKLNNKKRVLYYVPFYSGKCEGRHARMHDIWHYLNRDKTPEFDYEIIALKGKQKDSDRVYYPTGELYESYNPAKSSSHSIRYRVVSYLSMARLAFKAMRKAGSIDVFHATVLDPFTILMAKYFKWRNPKIKTVVGPNVMALLRQGQHVKQGVFNSHLVDHVLAIGEYHQDCLAEFGVDLRKLSPLPPSVDPHYFYCAKDKNTYEQKLSLLYVGNLSRFKGYDVFVEALKKIKENTDIKFQAKVAGNKRPDTPDEEILKEHIEYLGYVDRSELTKHYQDVDYYVHPGTDEFGPTTIVEALTCGIPCIVTDLPAFKEYDINNVCRTFRKGDAENLKDVIVEAYISKSNMHQGEPQNLTGKHADTIRFLKNLYS